MVIDFTSLAAEAGPGAPASPGSAPPTGLSLEEQFALRVGAEEPPLARARDLSAPGDTIVQGTIIPCVLETALNSDLPGYARAMVSRDVRSFDGSRVLVPRGSRLVGQYKSGLTTGQSRILIVWTRLIRPDGVSVQLASPALDGSGETGLGGKIDRRVLERYGGPAFLSILSGVAQSLGNGSSSTVVIAAGGGGQAIEAEAHPAPTVRVSQGAAIQVFTARDLDFSGF